MNIHSTPPTIFGIKRKTVFLVLALVLLGILLKAYWTSNQRQQKLFLKQEATISRLTEQNHEQQKLIENLQDKLTQSIEENRTLFDSEIRNSIENQRQTILIQLAEANRKLQIATAELEDAKEFKLLRMAWEREEEIQNAEENQYQWQLEVARLQKKLDDLKRTGY
ncbi:MAG TPA: hypothetical protein PLI97_05480 [Fluviicola sp.]|nr:hypothetical protein [Fluviicola sp.]